MSDKRYNFLVKMLPALSKEQAILVLEYIKAKFKL